MVSRIRVQVKEGQRYPAAAHFGWLMVLFALLWPAGALPAGSQSSTAALRLEIHGAITSATNTRLRSALGQAQAARAKLLLIELDTPGGLLDPTRAAVRQILDAPLPVVVYVSPDGARAGSAGLFFVLAAHVAAMVPTSNLGAAHPVSIFGGNVGGDMRDKVVSDTAAWARSLAERRGRDAERAAQAVVDSTSWTAKEALSGGLIDLVMRDQAQLLSALDGRSVKVQGKAITLHTKGIVLQDVPRSTGEALYDVLADPNLVYLLLLLGLAGLFLEFQQPGLWVPGALGATSLLLFFFVQTLPINGLGLGMILAAVVLLILEIYITSFGLLAVAGMACLVAGSYMLFDVPGSSIQLSPLLIWLVAGSFCLAFLGIGWLLARAKMQGPTSGAEALVGQTAVVYTPIAPAQHGKIFFDGTYWDATADEELAVGTRVRVVQLTGLLVQVEPLNGVKGTGQALG